MRNGVRVEEDSNHMASQIIVNTSDNTVYNNTLRVRGRERGTYQCTLNSERHVHETSSCLFSTAKSIGGIVIHLL